jgi:two-component system, cell cycle response regulator DivK
VTAQAMVGDREKSLKAGANAYISKPVDVDVLLRLLNKY